MKEQEKIPSPTLPLPNGVIRAPQSYGDVSSFSSLTQATFESLYDSVTGKDDKDSFSLVQGSTEQKQKRKQEANRLLF